LTRKAIASLNVKALASFGQIKQNKGTFLDLINTDSKNFYVKQENKGGFIHHRFNAHLKVREALVCLNIAQNLKSMLVEEQDIVFRGRLELYLKAVIALHVK